MPKNQKIVFLKGLPASSKSTWAKKLVDDNPGKYKRISKDDLRLMFDNSKWSKSNEKFILKVRDTLIKEALIEGYDVIVDDTNLLPIHLVVIKDIAETFGATVEINDSFLEVPLEECIKRDAKRANSVGSEVIRGMYNRYLKPEPVKYEEDIALAHCALIDIDGSLATKSPDRGYFDWGKVGLDTVNKHVASIVNNYKGQVIVLSGRDSVCKKETFSWLSDNLVCGFKLIMRPERDTRDDTVIKKEIFDREIKGKYYVDFVLDDRMKVIRMWKSLGLEVLSCNPLAIEY